MRVPAPGGHVNGVARLWLSAMALVLIAAAPPVLRYRGDYNIPWGSPDDPEAGLPIDIAEGENPVLEDQLGNDVIACYLGRDGKRICESEPPQVPPPPPAPGAVAAEENRNPWQVETFVTDVRGGWSKQHWCGGSVIKKGAAEAWVLTAAHCTRSTIAAMDTVRVRLGAYDLSLDQGAIYRIDQMVIHADWSQAAKINDIAVLHVVPDARARRPIPMSGGQPPGTARQALFDVEPIKREAPHPGQRDWLRIGQTAALTGWGAMAHGGPPRDTLGIVWLKLVSNLECEKTYGRQITARVICAYAPGKDACQGDSGGPLSVDQIVSPGVARYHPTLIGIVAYGKGCAQPRTPGVYTRVLAYHDWIEAALNERRRGLVRLPEPASMR
jgi:Trypsin